MAFKAKLINEGGCMEVMLSGSAPKVLTGEEIKQMFPEHTSFFEEIVSIRTRAVIYVTVEKKIYLFDVFPNKDGETGLNQVLELTEEMMEMISDESLKTFPCKCPIRHLRNFLFNAYLKEDRKLFEITDVQERTDKKYKMSCLKKAREILEEHPKMQDFR